MKFKSLNLLLILVIITVSIFASCSQKKEDAELSAASTEAIEEMQLTDSIAVTLPSSQYLSTDQTKRQFIRTADLKFRVKDVLASSEAIERLAGIHGGFITNSEIKSTDPYTNSTQVTEDSVLETHLYTLINEVVLRIPDYFYDSAISIIGKNSDYWDYRSLKAEDVSLSLYGNQMSKKRLSDNEKRVKQQINSRQGKLKDGIEAEEKVYQSQQEYDNVHLNQLELTDKVKFSTINITLYQRPSIAYTMIPLIKEVKQYEPSYLEKMKNALRHGLLILESISLFFITIWPLMAILSGLIWIFRKRIKTRLTR